MKKRNLKKLPILGLMLALLLSISFCISASAESCQLDILSNLNMDSVTQAGDCVYFEVQSPSGDPIRFCGLNVTVDAESITLNVDGKLFSLDYMGEMISLEVHSNDMDAWFEFGLVYADSASVETYTDLHIASYASIGIVPEIDLSESAGGFFSLLISPSGDAPVRFDTLVVTYDPSAIQQTYGELSAAEQQMLRDYAVFWVPMEEELPMEEPYVPLDEPSEYMEEYPLDPDPLLEAEGYQGYDFEKLADEMMAQPGTLQSDLLTGIDRSTVQIDGDVTFFTSVMVDGTAIRFEATNITITEDSVIFHPGATLTSLDAVGQIYQFVFEVDHAEEYPEDCFLECGYGYTYSASKTSVARASEIHTYGSAGTRVIDLVHWNRIPTAQWQPNFVYFATNAGNSRDIILRTLSIGYNPDEKVTAITAVRLAEEFTTPYLQGDSYDVSLEALASIPGGSLDFYLWLQPDTPYGNIDYGECSICYVPSQFYTIGALRNAQGQEMDKNTASVNPGDTLDLTVGDYSLMLELDVLERYAGAATLKELLPHATLDGLGECHALVVPVVWADQPENATDDNLTIYRAALGRVMDITGSAVDYSVADSQGFSLSEYFDIASYGKFQLSSFMTDWYHAEECFAEMEYSAISKGYADSIVQWVKAVYPDLDWSQYDRDGDGYIDALVIINSGTSGDDGGYSIASYGGAVEFRESYFADNARRQDDPTVNTFVTINQRFLQDGNINTLIHEFSHLFGLIDYYDVTYSGIDAVGKFDMQSSNVGDWNAYSKLAVGWMNPQVVTGLSSGESVELTIGTSAVKDDVIVIPAAGSDYDGPFGEYIMIDLFSDLGVNTYDGESYGLTDTVGIRISHVNANMEKRTIDAAAGEGSSELVPYTIGTIHYPNSYNEDGKYNIEVIQSGGENTFTNPVEPATSLSASDLFYAGDVFTLEKYSAFFQNARMDDGSNFGYTVQIVSIGSDEDGAPVATLRITAD